VGVALAIAAFAVPASARDQYVLDNAGLLSAATVQSLNQTIGDFANQTGKEVVVVTEPTLGGKTIAQSAEDVFAQEQINGVLILLAKAEKQDIVVGDRASRAFFPAGTFANIRDAMRGYLRSGDFDGGVSTGVNLVLDQYRSHERALVGGATGSPVTSSPQTQSLGGFGLFWLILTLLAGFLIIRSIFRALAGPRMMPPPGYGPGGPGMMGGFGGPGYGPGYGGGFGYGGGGGGFFSGLLGGLGGAWLGNELFNNHGGNMFGGGGQVAGLGDPNAGGGFDNSGWQPDAGQADMGNASFGGFGDSGGGFDGGGGGFGDSGGGGGW